MDTGDEFMCSRGGINGVIGYIIRTFDVFSAYYTRRPTAWRYFNDVFTTNNIRIRYCLDFFRVVFKKEYGNRSITRFITVFKQCNETIRRTKYDAIFTVY